GGNHADLCGVLEDEPQRVRSGEFFVGLILFFFLFFILVFDVLFLVVYVYVVVEVVVLIVLIVLKIVIVLFIFEFVVALLFVVGVAQGGEVLAGGVRGGIAVYELRIGFEVGGDVVAHQVAKVADAVSCRHRILVGHREGSPWAAACLPVGCRLPEKRSARIDFYSVNGRSFASLGLVVRRLTRQRHISEAISAGRIASRSATDAGRCWLTNGLSQKRVTMVPTAMLETAPAAVARRQKNAARMTGVRAAE